MRATGKVGMITVAILGLGAGLDPLRAAVTIETTVVGNPGNAAYGSTGWGSVSEPYRIAKYEVTNAQYAEFLNAVAATDTKGLYHTSMPGISRSGSSGSYTYSVVTGQADKPVVYVDWYDAIRFCNWLHNGQPAGAQDATTTEDGAYTLALGGANGANISRLPGATYFLPTHEMWHKAAYYDPTLNGGTGGYRLVATHVSTVPTATAPNSTTANSANYFNAVGALTDAGAYTLATSFYGLFDTMGNAEEWFDKTSAGGAGGIRGGNYVLNFNFRMRVSDAPAVISATTVDNRTGFRVAAPYVASAPAGTVVLIR